MKSESATTKEETVSATAEEEEEDDNLGEYQENSNCGDKRQRNGTGSLASEYKRRQTLRDKFKQLTERVPSLQTPGSKTEAVILQKTVEYMNQLIENRSKLQDTIKELNVALGQPATGPNRETVAEFRVEEFQFEQWDEYRSLLIQLKEAVNSHFTQLIDGDGVDIDEFDNCTEEEVEDCADDNDDPLSIEEKRQES